MILHLIELTYVGPFRDTVRIGPFCPGLNVLAAPNEAGKSTSIRAAARALFDKHTTKGEELKALQPAGSDLAPRISVEFETSTGRYRIEKTFLQSPRSFLRHWQHNAWQPIAEADAADQRMQDLLQSSIPGRGATKPEHWGFLGFLWARQGEPVEWPKLEDEAVGQRIRARLARIELDPVIELLRERLSSLAEAIITSTGQSKTGGPLRQAEDDLAVIETELTKLRQTCADLETKHQRFHQLAAEVLQLEREHIEREESAKTLAAQALAAERLRGELETRQVELTTAQEKLNIVATDGSTLAQRSADLVGAKKDLSTAENSMKADDAQFAGLRQKIDAHQANRPNIETKLNALRAEHLRVQETLKLRQSVTDATALSKQVAKAEKAASQVAALQVKRTKIPAITQAKVRKLEESNDTVRELRAQVQALGLAMELTPERETKAIIKDGNEIRRETLKANKRTNLHSPQSLDLQLTGWGRVVVRSGAKEAQELGNDLAAAETNLRDSLVEAEVATLEAAREAVASRKDLDTQIKAGESSLADQLGDYDSLDGLREAAVTAKRRRENLNATFKPTPEEQALSVTHFESADERYASSIPAAEKDLKAFDKALDQLRADERDAAKKVQGAVQLANERRTQLKTLEIQIEELLARYPEGVEPAKAKAQVEFTKAEARVTAIRAELPADFVKLPERNRRAAAALQQLANDLQAKRAARDGAKGSLETLGGLGLYSQETELEERKVEAEMRREAARTKGWASRVAHDLIEYRKHAATKAVLAPLEQRLTTAFADLTADAQRKVFLDDRLQIAGVGQSRDEAYPFDSLSQGAKEQLLLCLRIAVAQELSTSEAQVLILDDVLVNTDPVRQERVLDVLGQLAAKLQIIILTCHPERYRGIGTSIQLPA